MNKVAKWWRTAKTVWFEAGAAAVLIAVVGAAIGIKSAESFMIYQLSAFSVYWRLLDISRRTPEVKVQIQNRYQVPEDMDVDQLAALLASHRYEMQCMAGEQENV